MLNYQRFLLIFTTTIFINFNHSYSAINNKIIVKVGNEIITSYELENKIRTILFLSKKKINQENINIVKQKAISGLINKKLKQEEIVRYGISINQDRVDSYLNEYSSKLNMNKEDFIKAMNENNISFNLYNGPKLEVSSVGHAPRSK